MAEDSQETSVANSDQSTSEEAFLTIVESRITKWSRWWKFYMYSHYSLGVIGVICSTLAASTLLGAPAPQWFSLVSAMCFAIIGFVRPEAKYRNLVRAWSELKGAKEAYLFQTDEKRSELLRALRECQKIAIEDDMQIAGVASDQRSDKKEKESDANGIIKKQQGPA
ncbi:hypothetical protein [uncultured Thiodictyon sp.]|jgi:hypothetical protein|uniref:hypothetical protein n=1 Tax=uncultured Thiodictyon sp. TaxID=1846217 RepID=UPI0025D1A99B|nr:hypothetical protein [uncultured Thiodictyon sp.]